MFLASLICLIFFKFLLYHVVLKSWANQIFGWKCMWKAFIKDLINHALILFNPGLFFKFYSTVIRGVRVVDNMNPSESKIKKFRKKIQVISCISPLPPLSLEWLTVIFSYLLEPHVIKARRLKNKNSFSLFASNFANFSYFPTYLFPYFTG